MVGTGDAMPKGSVDEWLLDPFVEAVLASDGDHLVPKTADGFGPQRDHGRLLIVGDETEPNPRQRVVFRVPCAAADVAENSVIV